MWFRKSIHFLWQLLILAEFFTLAFFIRLFQHNPVKRRWLEIKNASHTSRRFLNSFHVKVRMKNPERLQQLQDKNYLVVGNHASYLDMFVLAAQENYVFITSVEMSETPVLGEIVRAAGCLYTNRKKKFSLPEEIRRFSDTVKQGFKVVLYPETSGTDGVSIKEFRKSLFQVAVNACCTVLPVCVRYLRIDGTPVNDLNRKDIFWYKGIRFVQHLWNLLARRLEAEISFLEPIDYDPNRSRGELSDLVYEQVNETFCSYNSQ
jgi:lyso-ornithine lipid O-acyltransferase